MPAISELAVLMALRIRGGAGAADVARGLGCGEQAVATALDALQARGVVTAAPPRGFVLDVPGRDELTRLLAAEAIDRAALAAAYERFEVVDRELKLAITAWQVADAVGKSRAAAAVVAVASRAAALADDVARLVPRSASYAARLGAAARALRDGDTRFVANPRVDSLHQAWFELHEDLLVTLGRSRVA